MKNSILKSCEKFLSNRNSFAYRVCKSLRDGDFNDVLSSQGLINLLNEFPGKKVKVNSLTAQMQTLLKEDIVKMKTIGRGRNKRKYWFPGWLDRKDIDKILNEKEIMFFSGKDSWTDSNKNFPKIIQMLEGNLCIVDPFYGNGTFYALEKFGKNRKIRFLTCRLGDEEQKNITQFDINLKRFKREFKNIEMKRYDKFYELHDRYIISDNALVIIGYGIKDLAGAESFVIFLPKNIIATFLPTLKKMFEGRWEKANNLK